MKVILGPLPCRGCGSPVTIVRRDVAYPGCCYCEWHGSDNCQCAKPHTHTLPDVGPFTPVDEDGTRHKCQVSA